MRHDKAVAVINLARQMAGSAEGVTIEEVMRDTGLSRRAAERLRDAVVHLFPQAEEVSDPPFKRWRIRGGLSGFEQAPTTGELVELSKAAKALTVAGEPNRAAALSGLEAKIKAAMRSNVLTRLAPDLEALMRAETIAVQAGPRPTADDAVLAPVREAILSGRPLGFTYVRPGAEPGRRSVSPCGLMFGRANYLVALDRKSGEIRTYRLDRMSEVRAEDGHAPAPDDFDLAAFANRSFGIYQDAVEEVVLEVSPEGADEARAWRWHPTQKLEDRLDGGVTVRFEASGMRELAWHLFTWSGQVKIVAPERLKTVMAEELDKARTALA